MGQRDGLVTGRNYTGTDRTLDISLLERCRLYFSLSTYTLTYLRLLTDSPWAVLLGEYCVYNKRIY